MKTILFSTLLFISSSLFSQVEKLTWHTDLVKAIEISTKEKKPLMLFFTGSDWCGWCIRLQKEVFYKPEFIEWANDNVVLVDIDFPRNKSKQSAELQQQNNLLQQQFGIQGLGLKIQYSIDKSLFGEDNLVVKLFLFLVILVN